MAKLYFRYGAMGSSKTANALMVRYNFLEKGQKVILVKPDNEIRDGRTKIKSRIGLEADCTIWSEFVKNYMETGRIAGFQAVIVDEVQFLAEVDIDMLAGIVDQYDIPVLCYGLRTDFTSRLFPGSKRLMELADIIEEIKTVCWCGKKAIMTARLDENGQMARSGDQVVMGGNETYVSLCRKHYLEGMPFGKMCKSL